MSIIKFLHRTKQDSDSEADEDIDDPSTTEGSRKRSSRAVSPADGDASSGQSAAKRAHTGSGTYLSESS